MLEALVREEKLTRERRKVIVWFQMYLFRFRFFFFFQFLFLDQRDSTQVVAYDPLPKSA